MIKSMENSVDTGNKGLSHGWGVVGLHRLPWCIVDRSLRVPVVVVVVSADFIR